VSTLSIRAELCIQNPQISTNSLNKLLPSDEHRRSLEKALTNPSLMTLMTIAMKHLFYIAAHEHLIPIVALIIRSAGPQRVYPPAENVNILHNPTLRAPHFAWSCALVIELS
jgi:hypothetical protein